jgi:hypothetical protein
LIPVSFWIALSWAFGLMSATIALRIFVAASAAGTP